MTAHIDFGRSNQPPCFTATKGPALSLGTVLADPFYIVGTFYGSLGIADLVQEDAPSQRALIPDWDMAVRTYAVTMDDRQNAAVIKIDLAKGTAQDVTKEAVRHYLRALREARMADPEWMEVAP